MELMNIYYERRTIPVILPYNWYYKLWWIITVFAAMFGMFLETYLTAFSEGGLSTRSSSGVLLGYILYGTFALDIIINFNLAFYDENDKLVFARPLIAYNYMKKMFWVDLVGVFPFFVISLLISGQMGESNKFTQNLALLRLTTLVRLHRVPRFFSVMKYSSRISLMGLTLVRDLSAVLTWTHIWACVMFIIARELAFDPDNTWLGSDITSLSEFERYVVSLYWSIVTFSTVGYGDFSPVHPIEQIFVIIYMILNVVLMAWVIGSITLLIVKADEKTGLYRETLHVLNKYATLHDFDQDLTKKLRNQLRLDFDNREIADEQVLQFFPVGVRRRVLRRLYMQSLINTKLMIGTRQQYKDAFLSQCKVEVFSPGDELLQRGVISSELYLLLDGSLEVVSSGSNLDNSPRGVGDSDFVAGAWSMADSTEMGSVTGRRRIITKGEFVNELGFFTETPQMDTIRTRSVCKILTMSKSDFKALSNDHPGSACRVLANLLAKVQELPAKSILSSNSHFDRESEADIAQAEVHVEHTKVVVEDLIKMHINKQKDEHTTRFCFAASRGVSRQLHCL